MFKRIAMTLILGAIVFAVSAQVPQQMNYQGIARNANGEPITFQSITVRLSFIDSASGGQVVYRETRSVRTNYVGLFNIVIGSAGATALNGSIQDINWASGRKFIKLEIDPHGLSN